jgi:hypothetical protein
MKLVVGLTFEFALGVVGECVGGHGVAFDGLNMDALCQGSGRLSIHPYIHTYCDNVTGDLHRKIGEMKKGLFKNIV